MMMTMATTLMMEDDDNVGGDGAVDKDAEDYDDDDTMTRMVDWYNTQPSP